MWKYNAQYDLSVSGKKDMAVHTLWEKASACLDLFASLQDQH